METKRLAPDGARLRSEPWGSSAKVASNYSRSSCLSSTLFVCDLDMDMDFLPMAHRARAPRPAAAGSSEVAATRLGGTAGVAASPWASAEPDAEVEESFPAPLPAAAGTTLPLGVRDPDGGSGHSGVGGIVDGLVPGKYNFCGS